MQGQEIKFNLQKIGPEEGLDSRYVFGVHKDTDGFLWVNTKTGINRFDGYSVKNYKNKNDIFGNELYTRSFKSEHSLIWNIYQSNDLPSLISGKVHKIHALEFNFRRLHIEIFDPKTNKEISLKEFFPSLPFAEEKILDIYNSPIGVVFVFLDHLYKYDGKFERIELPNEMKNKVFSSYINKNEVKVFLTPTAFYIYNKKWQLVRKGVLAKNHRGREILIADNNKIWILARKIQSQQNRLFFIDGLENNVIKTPILQDHKFLQQLLEYQDITKEIAILRADSEVFIYKKDNNEFIKINDYFENYDLKKISFRAINKINSTIYLSSSEGVILLNSQKNKFTTYFTGDEKMLGFRSIESLDNKLLINSYLGTKNWMGLDDKTMDQINFVDIGIPIYYDKKDHSIWKGGYTQLVIQIPLDNIIKAKHYVLDSIPLSCLSIKRSTFSNQVFIGTSRGLHLLNEDSLSVTKINNLDAMFPSLNINVNYIEEVKNILWLATSIGLLKYDIITGEVIKIQFNNNNLVDIKLSHIFIDTDSTYWLSSSQNGLISWNEKTNDLKQYTQNEGLSHNKVHAVKSDGENLWISTNFGLNKLNKKTENIISYYEEDGIAHNEFNKFSHHQTSDGTIYFGGIDGLTEIRPNELKQLNLDTLKIASIEVEVKTKDDVFETLNYSETETINFDPTDKNIKFKIIPSKLFQANKNNYFYRIKHQGDRWQSINQNEINFANLPYGHLSLDIRIERDGQDNSDDIFSIKIFSEKPYYFKLPFVFLAGFCLFGFGLWLVKIRTNYLVKKQVKLENIIAERTSELTEMNEVKRKLFSVLAHDIRNPIASLTNITTKVQYLVSKNEPELLDKLTVQIDSKLHNLNRNLDNILNWALADDKKIPYNPKNYIIHNQCISVLSLYSEFMNQKDLSYHISCKEDQIVYADETAIQTILRNIIHNAIKFSEEGGLVQLQIKEIDSTNLSIQIKNKISTSPQKPNRKGMGLGLNIVNELTQLNQGSFSKTIDSNNFTAIIILPYKSTNLNN